MFSVLSPVRPVSRPLDIGLPKHASRPGPLLPYISKYRSQLRDIIHSSKCTHELIDTISPELLAPRTPCC